MKNYKVYYCILAALAVMLPATAAMADAPAIAVPSVDYSATFTAMSTWASTFISSNAPTIILVSLAFVGLGLTMKWVKKAAK